MQLPVTCSLSLLLKGSFTYDAFLAEKEENCSTQHINRKDMVRTAVHDRTELH